MLVLLLAGFARADVPVWEAPEQLCGEQEPCRVASTSPAGADRQGRPLIVVELVHDETDDGVEPSYGGPCTRREWYLVGPSQPGGRLLHSACNDGYGARGMGEDRVTVVPGVAAAPGRFIASRSGGSAWGWSVGVTLGLDPVERLEQHNASFFTLGPQTSDTSLDARTGRRQVRWEAGSCEGAGEDVGLGAADLSGAFAVVPLVEPDLGGTWTDLDISGCGAEPLMRPRSDAARASTPEPRMWVVARGPRELLVQVWDPSWTDAGASWLYEDHLEIWVGTEHVDPYDNGCVAALPPPVQWGVRLRASDVGRVQPGFGKPPPDALVADVVEVDSHTRRARIVLPEAVGALTVVFSDVTGPDAQALYATSEVSFGNAASLGGKPESSDTPAGTCEVQGRALRWRPSAVRSEEAATGLGM